MAKPKEPIKGETFVANIEHVTQVRISSDKVKELLNDEELKKVATDIEFDQLKITRISGKKAEFKLPNLDNATTGGLVDMLGELRERMKDDKKMEGILKTALDARLLEAEREKARQAELEGK